MGSVKILDVIYAEPKLYSKRERTEFSDKAVTSVRQVIGFEGLIDNDTTNDVLVIGAGYESHLIAEVAEDYLVFLPFEQTCTSKIGYV